MKSLLLQSMRSALAILLLLGLAVSLAPGGAVIAVPARLQIGVLALAGCGLLFALLFHRVRGEDRIAGLEAALCREQNARSQADLALAESDLLLGRLTTRGIDRRGVDRRGIDRRGVCRRGSVDAVAQLATIQSELIQLRQHCVLDDPLLASRVDLLCTRIACVAQAMDDGRAVNTG